MNKRLFFGSVLGMFLLPLNASAGLESVARTPLIAGVVSTVIYSLVGMIMVFVAFKVIDLLTPGNLAKEITENKNVALALLVSSMMLGVSIIIAGVMIG